jgi:hypothetical protein
MKKVFVVIFASISCFCGLAEAQNSLTIYSDGIALVKRNLELDLKRGIQTVSSSGLPKLVEPESIELSIPGQAASLIEQSFYPPRNEPYSILSTYIGKKIVVRLKEGEIVEGLLHSVQGPVIQTSEGLVVISQDAVERYEIPEIPRELRTFSEVLWTIESKTNTKTDAMLTFLSGGFDWKALYTAVLDEKQKKIEITSRVSITNSSGASYSDASLKLVAGNIHRAAAPRARGMALKTMDAMAAAPQEQFEQRAFSEYYMYDLARFVSIADGELKQIKLYDKANVNVDLRYIYDQTVNADRVTRSVVFVNSEKQGLGRPLPEGIVKIFSRDSDGSLELAGEDMIRHIPRDEEVSLSLGTAFDITAEKRITDMERISQRIREQKVEITLRNRKDEPVEIRVVEHLWGVWEILKSSHPYTKKDATTVEFTIKVPARGETTVSYTARFQ